MKVGLKKKNADSKFKKILFTKKKIKRIKKLNFFKCFHKYSLKCHKILYNAHF